MGNNVIFHEVQKPSKTMSNIFVAIIIISIVTQGIFYISTDMKEVVLSFSPVPIVFFIIVLLSSILSLTVSIDECGVNYKCTQFQSSSNHISFNDIDELIIGQIKVPFRYKGFKVQASGNRKLYLFGGYDAITIKKKDGQVIILGTKKKEKLIESVSKIKNVNIRIV